MFGSNAFGWPYPGQAYAGTTTAVQTVTGSSGIVSGGAFGTGGVLLGGTATITGAAGIVSGGAFGTNGKLAFLQFIAGSSGVTSGGGFGTNGVIQLTSQDVVGSLGIPSGGAFGANGQMVFAQTLVGVSGISSGGAFGVGGLQLSLPIPADDCDLVLVPATEEHAIPDPVTVVLQAEDDMNSGVYASTVTVGDATYVIPGTTTETLVQGSPPDTNWFSMGAAPAMFYVRGERLPATGTYTIDLLIRGSGSGAASFPDCFIVVRRNGVEITPSVRIDVLSNLDEWQTLNDPFPTNNSTNAGAGPTVFPVVEGDTYEFCLFNPSDSTFGVDQIRFNPVSAGAPNGATVSMLTVPVPVGSATIAGADLRIGSTTRVEHLDMCVTTNGDVYVFWVESVAGNENTVSLVAKKWDGSSWTLLTDDLWGHGTEQDRALLPWVCCETDGTNVFFLFGDIDDTTTGGTENKIWRLKKYDGASFTELGTGQRAIVTRTNNFAELGGDSTAMTLAVSPAGVPWVFWGENIDVNNSLTSGIDVRLPHANYWNGSSWVDTGLVPNTHVRPFYTIYVTTNVNAFGVVFPSGSENPSLIFNYQDGIDSAAPDGPFRTAFQYQEWNGSSWGGVLDFTSTSVWPDLLEDGGLTEHWTQGIRLFEYQNSVWLLAALAIHNHTGAQGAVAQLSGSTFVAPENPYYDRPLWPDSRSGWGAPTGGTPRVDDNGDLWVLVTRFLDNPGSGLIALGRREVGTTDGWSIAHYDPVDHATGGSQLPVYEEFQICETPFRFHGSDYYIFFTVDATTTFPLVLFKGTYDTPYEVPVFGDAPVDNCDLDLEPEVEDCDLALAPFSPRVIGSTGSGRLLVGEAGIPSAEAFGAGAAQTVLGGSGQDGLGIAGITSGETFGVGGIISAGAARLIGAHGISSGGLFGIGGSVNAGNVLILSGGGIVSAEAFGLTGKVVQKVIGSTGIPSGGAFGSTGILHFTTGIKGTSGIASAGSFGTNGKMTTTIRGLIGIPSPQSGTRFMSLTAGTTQVGGTATAEIDSDGFGTNGSIS